MKRSARNPGFASFLIWGSMMTGVLLVPSGHSQSSNGRLPAFEVASIRPAGTQGEGGEGNSRSQIEYAADGLTMLNVDLSEMIQWAYDLEHYQVLVPGILEGQRYDVRARSGDPVAVNTLRLMLQDLLATRFKVKHHQVQKRIPVYELVVAKGGPRLPKSNADTVQSSSLKESLPRVIDGSFVFTNVSIPEFAKQLTELRGIELPVVDRTGIQGVYDITLKSAASALLEPNGPSLLTLIQEQIGLKLVSAKDPVEIVVVDRAEKPSAN
jgi:uncharacterized protein (TIGR03435 family)